MPSPGPERSEGQPRRANAVIAVLVFGAALIVGGLAFGAVPLFVPGIGFVLLGLLAPLWVAVAVRTARVRRELDVRRVVEDEPLEATVFIRRGLFGLPGGELHDPLAGPAISVAEPLSIVAGRLRVQLRVVARIHRRGRHRFAPPRIVVSDPFGLSRRNLAGDGEDDELLVLPRIERVRWVRLQDRKATAGARSRATPDPVGAGEIDGLRAYMPGTPASRIHWPALARYPSPGNLLERRLVSEPQVLPLVVLDARQDQSAEDEEHLDAAVRAAASLTFELARTGGCGLLLPGERVATVLGADLAGWPALHARLALVERELDPRLGPSLRPETVHGSLIYVAARRDPQASMPGAASKANPLVLVLPTGLRSQRDPPASFHVAGCAGHLLAGAMIRRKAAAA